MKSDDILTRAREGLTRHLTIRQIDADARTVEVAFASDTPVERFFGTEVLAITPAAIRLDRMTGGAAVLMDHRWDDQIGVVEGVTIGTDGVARAVLRFGKGTRADEVFQDIKDGIRRHVSVGYMVHKIEVEAREGQADMVTVTDWEPFEVSIVAVPADPAVGVGRSAEQTQTNIVESDMTTETTTPPQAGPDQAQKRVTDTLALGQAYGRDDLAARILRDGGGPDEMRAALLAAMDNGRSAPLSDAGMIGMSDGDRRDFSLVKLVRHLANPSSETAAQAGLELEASRAFAQRTGRDPEGVYLPPDLSLPAGFGRRDMTTATPAAGGSLVATNLLAENFVDALRNRLAVYQAGATIIAGLTGNVAIPRLAGGTAHEWLPEAGAATDVSATFDTITMSPHTIAVSIPISRRLLIQSTPDVENVLRRDIMASVARGIDGAALNGHASADAPTGLREIIAASAMNWSTAGKPTFAEMVALETAVAEANADEGGLGYIYGAAMAGHLKTTVIEAGNPAMIEQDGQVNGMPRNKSNQAQAGDVFFGNFQDLIIGTWSGLDLRADTATLAASDGPVLRAFQDLDVGIRHPESFALGANV